MTDKKFILYNYFRSSASYRVRIALYYKHLPFEYIPVHLIKNGGEQFSDEYKKLNPQSQVPCLIHNGHTISQSMAIIQYLEDLYPEPNLFPQSAFEKALTIQICEAVNSGIQPLQNLIVSSELEKRFKATAKDKSDWIIFWNHKGLDAIETILKSSAGEFCVGNSVTAADCFLVPQVFSAKRFGVDVSLYPTIMRVNNNALALEAFQLADPAKQPDYSA